MSPRLSAPVCLRAPSRQARLPPGPVSRQQPRSEQPRPFPPMSRLPHLSAPSSPWAPRPGVQVRVVAQGRVAEGAEAGWRWGPGRGCVCPHSRGRPRAAGTGASGEMSVGTRTTQGYQWNPSCPRGNTRILGCPNGRVSRVWDLGSLASLGFSFRETCWK